MQHASESAANVLVCHEDFGADELTTTDDVYHIIEIENALIKRPTQDTEHLVL